MKMRFVFKFRPSVALIVITLFIVLQISSSKFINFDGNDNTIKDIKNSKNNSSQESGNHGFLIDLLSNAFRLLNLRKVVKDVQQGKSSSSSSACMSCKFGFAMAQHLVQFGKDKNEIAAIARYLCKTLNLETVRVCEGMVDQFKDEFLTVISRLDYNPNEICGNLLGEPCAKVYSPLYNWTLPLSPIPKPALRPTRSLSKVGSPTLKVLHLSDTHIDPFYAEGGDAVCGEPLCCRNSSSFVGERNRAGFWGDYRDCDIPLRTLEHTLKFIARHHHDIDYVIWTGDIPPHDVWNQTREGQLAVIRLVADTMHKHLGHIPIYPALGNHESTPLNSFPTPDVEGKYSISWLHNTLEELWSQWLPSHTLASIKKGAFYALEVRPGLKLISLNMNYCNNQNWWLLLNATDPAGELQWFTRELQASELIGEKVHIIGHIPPGSNDCLSKWSANYNKIVNRFESTITGQFFGHTHQDEFEIFYETMNNTAKGEQNRPTGVAYIGPSVTTFGNVNPGYRIYTIDGDHQESTYEVLDFDTYYMNLPEANKDRDSKPLKYSLSYSARQDLQMADLSAQNWHNLVIRMRNDIQLFRKFYKLFYNRSDSIRDTDCDGRVCRRDILCRLITASSHNDYYCKKFL